MSVPFQRRDFAGGAVSTTLVGSVTALSTSWTIADATGWPVGTNGPFYAVFSRGSDGLEEKVLVASVSGTTVTLASSASRGVDGTIAQAHAAPETFEHCYSAIDADEANLEASQGIGQIQALGDVLTGRTINRLQRTAAGANNTLWVVDSSQPGGMRFAVLPTSAVSSAAQIADGTITRPKVASSFWGSYARRSLASSTPTVSTGTLTVQVFATLDYDADGLFSSTSRFTALVDGVYQIDAGIAWPGDSAAPTSSTRRYLGLRLNGSTFIDEDSRLSIPSATVGTRNSLSSAYKISAGSYVEVCVQQDGTGTFTLPATSASHFGVAMLRPF